MQLPSLPGKPANTASLREFEGQNISGDDGDATKPEVDPEFVLPSRSDIGMLRLLFEIKDSALAGQAGSGTRLHASHK